LRIRITPVAPACATIDISGQIQFRGRRPITSADNSSNAPVVRPAWLACALAADRSSLPDEAARHRLGPSAPACRVIIASTGGVPFVRERDKLRAGSGTTAASGLGAV